MSSIGDINAIYQSALGRSADKSGLDYWSKMAEEKGMDYVKNSIGGSREAQLYNDRGAGLTVAKNDQVSGLSYKNKANVASQQATSKQDYGLLSAGMNDLAQSGAYTLEKDASGSTLYRSQSGGLYDINGMAVSDPAPRSAVKAQVTNNQTSQGQLQQMLASDSPLMQQASTQGQQQANARGLLNSSMAGQASQAAMISAATPFAQQDAQTYYNAAQANAARQHELDKMEAQQQYTLGQMGVSQQYMLDQMDASSEDELNQLFASSNANAWGVMSNNVTDIVAQSMDAINNIQANTDITASDKTKMIEQIMSMRNSDIQFQQDLYSSLSTYLDNTNIFPTR